MEHKDSLTEIFFYLLFIMHDFFLIIAIALCFVDEIIYHFQFNGDDIVFFRVSSYDLLYYQVLGPEVMLTMFLSCFLQYRDLDLSMPCINSYSHYSLSVVLKFFHL